MEDSVHNAGGRVTRILQAAYRRIYMVHGHITSDRDAALAASAAP